jgi:hypothetical protein
MIVVALITVAFAKHLFENKSRRLPATSASMPAASPTIHAEEEHPDPDDSR